MLTEITNEVQTARVTIDKVLASLQEKTKDVHQKLLSPELYEFHGLGKIRNDLEKLAHLFQIMGHAKPVEIVNDLAKRASRFDLAIPKRSHVLYTLLTDILTWIETHMFLCKSEGRSIIRGSSSNFNETHKQQQEFFGKINVLNRATKIIDNLKEMVDHLNTLPPHTDDCAAMFHKVNTYIANIRDSLPFATVKIYSKSHPDNALLVLTKLIIHPKGSDVNDLSVPRLEFPIGYQGPPSVVKEEQKVVEEESPGGKELLMLDKMQLLHLIFKKDSVIGKLRARLEKTKGTIEAQSDQIRSLKEAKTGTSDAACISSMSAIVNRAKKLRDPWIDTAIQYVFTSQERINQLTNFETAGEAVTEFFSQLWKRGYVVGVSPERSYIMVAKKSSESNNLTMGLTEMYGEYTRYDLPRFVGGERQILLNDIVRVDHETPFIGDMINAALQLEKDRGIVTTGKKLKDVFDTVREKLPDVEYRFSDTEDGKVSLWLARGMEGHYLVKEGVVTAMFCRPTTPPVEPYTEDLNGLNIWIKERLSTIFDTKAKWQLIKDNKSTDEVPPEFLTFVGDLYAKGYTVSVAEAKDDILIVQNAPPQAGCGLYEPIFFKPTLLGRFEIKPSA